MNLDASGTFKLILRNTNGTYEYPNSSSRIPLNQWSYLAFTFKDGLVKLYINGKYINSQNITTTSLYSTVNQNIVFGSYFNTTGTPLTGYLDEAKIYNYALTDSEIALDYNQGSAIAANSFSSADSGNTAPSSANSQLYCVPGDSATCTPPIAEWNFDEGTGSTAYDKSGNSNNAVLKNNLAWVPGKFNDAINFAATNQYLDAGTSPTIGLTTAGTLEAWVKPSSYPLNGAWKVVAAKGNWGGGRNYFSIYYSGWNSMLNFGVGNSTTNCVFAITQNTTPLNIFSHVTLSWNNIGIYAYVNGILVGSAASCIPDTTGPLYIGGINGGYGATGIIDQIRLYDYVRTPAQIALDYNRGGPVAWWKFDDCQGSIAYDSSGIGNTGNISIGPSGTQNSLGTCSIGTSAAWTADASGKINSSLNFDGVDDYVDIGSRPSLNSITDISVSAWVQTSNNSVRQVIASRGNDWILVKTGNLYEFEHRNASNTIVIPQAVNTSTGWIHIVGTYSTAVGFAKLYINGVQVDSRAQTGLTRVSQAQNQIGNDYAWHSGNLTYNDYFWIGQLDDVRVYNYALTSEQVRQLYNNNASVKFAPATGSP